jgi:hypothetical protein
MRRIPVSLLYIHIYILFQWRFPIPKKFLIPVQVQSQSQSTGSSLARTLLLLLPKWLVFICISYFHIIDLFLFYESTPTPSTELLPLLKGELLFLLELELLELDRRLISSSHTHTFSSDVARIHTYYIYTHILYIFRVDFEIVPCPNPRKDGDGKGSILLLGIIYVGLSSSVQ